MVEEKFITLNLRKLIVKKQKWRRSEAAIFVLKRLLERRLKTDKIKISSTLNNFIWRRGAKNPETKIKVRVVKDGDFYKVELVS